jgi:hypothetical protein
MKAVSLPKRFIGGNERFSRYHIDPFPLFETGLINAFILE